MNKHHYDFVIIGSGTAGCVLANRLSQDSRSSVCLIEAGPSDKTPLVHTPALVATLMNHKTYGWGYTTSPQAGLNKRNIFIPRGRVLGGCSSTNGMAYFRGHPKDYDEWADMGCKGWSYRELLPYFIRSENNVEFRDSPYHGTHGEMHVSFVKKYNPLVSPFLSATEAMGFQRCDDFNGTMDPEGFGVRQGCIHNGRRVSGVTAYLKPIKSRKNLTIITNAHVNKILFKENRADSVEVNVDDVIRRFVGNREIILCGGAYGSPTILQHSGIGDESALTRLGIKTQHHLPAVGKNLHDHPSSVVQMDTKNTDSYGVSWRAFPRNFWSVFQYLLFRRGQFAGNVFEATGFVKTKPGLDRADVQFVFMPATRPSPKFPFPLGHGYGINSILLRPKSRGTVTLSSADPLTAPVIDTNFLGDDRDFEPLLRGLALARKILASPQFDPYASTEILPGPDMQDDETLKEYIREMASAVHHPGGTCRMGDDPDSVVDLELKVRGVDGLRVIDASVFPKVMGGNTNAAVVMVAEKAADIILGNKAPDPIDP